MRDVLRAVPVVERHVRLVVGPVEQQERRVLLPVLLRQRHPGRQLRLVQLVLRPGQPDERRRQVGVEVPQPRRQRLLG